MKTNQLEYLNIGENVVEWLNGEIEELEYHLSQLTYPHVIVLL